jgi:hypothetical protein
MKNLFITLKYFIILNIESILKFIGGISRVFFITTSIFLFYIITSYLMGRLLLWIEPSLIVKGLHVESFAYGIAIWTVISTVFMFILFAIKIIQCIRVNWNDAYARAKKDAK